MKNIFYSTFAMLLTAIGFSQEIVVREGVENIGGGGNSALTVLIYETDAKEVEKAWKNLMKDYKGKVSSAKDAILADDATITAISANTVDVYAKVTEQSGAVKLIVGFDLGGIFLSSAQKHDEYKKAKEIVYSFAYETTKASISEKLSQAEKEQEKLEKNLEQLKKDNDKLHNSIVKYKEQIIQAEKDIQTNLKDQEKTSVEIEGQKKVVNQIAAKLREVK